MNLKEIDNNIHILNDFDYKIGEIKQLNDDFLTMDISLDNYDVILCNPPFNTEIKKLDFSKFMIPVLFQLF